MQAPDASHLSSVQVLPSSVQPAPVANPFGGQAVDAPPHVSATSHSLTAGRQVAPAFAAACTHVPTSQASDEQGFESSQSASVVHLVRTATPKGERLVVRPQIVCVVVSRRLVTSTHTPPSRCIRRSARGSTTVPAMA